MLVLVLGVISFTGMTTDLLPAMELPYVVVMTTYPRRKPGENRNNGDKAVGSGAGDDGRH